MKSFHEADKHAPDYPVETCPDIDEVKDAIEKAVENLREEADVLNDLIGNDDKFEELRNQNAQLRESGIYWRDFSKELSEKVDELELSLEDMTAQRDSAKEEVEHMARALQEMMRQRDDFQAKCRQLDIENTELIERA